MTLYEYQCIQCGTVFSRRYPMGQAPDKIQCMSCGSYAKRKFSTSTVVWVGDWSPHRADPNDPEIWR